MPYVAQYQLCLNEARDKIVPCDSPEARSNLALPGAEIPDDVAQKYGLTGKAKDAPAPEPEAQPEEKARTDAPSNKAKTVGGASVK